MKTFLTTVAALGLASAALAQEPITYSFDGSFEDATFAVENAIVGQGLVIDYTSRVGDMLNRTGEDVGSSEVLFDAADIFIFCSAVVSRQVMEEDPTNIQHCPYGIYVTDRGGEVTIGHRDYPDGSMQPVEDLLAAIVADAGGM